MRHLLVILLIVAASSYTFEDYAAQFNKTYDSEADKLARKAIFDGRMAYNQQFNAQGHGYLLKPTKWTDRYDSEISQSLRVVFNTTGVSSSFQPPVSRLRVAGNSTGVDWRASGVTAVKDQGQCGDCWAFSSTALLQSYFMLKNNSRLDLSEEYVLECTKNGSTCEGGQIDKALDLLVATGAPAESTYPYLGMTYTSGVSPVTPTTPGICDTSRATFYPGYANTTMSDFYNKNKTFIMSLLDLGPLSSVIIADNDFMNYGSNVFKCNYTYTDALVNHAILVVGYNVTGNYYIIKNSWGTHWGMNGFAYVDMDLDCNIKRAFYQLTWESRLVGVFLLVLGLIAMIV